MFRWGERYRQASAEITDTFYDWDQLLADQGTINATAYLSTRSIIGVIICAMYNLNNNLIIIVQCIKMCDV